MILEALTTNYTHTIVIEKSINSYDNKRYILNDGITSLAHGHYKIKQQ